MWETLLPSLQRSQRWDITWTQRQRAENREKDRRGKNCPLMCAAVYNLLNAVRFLLFLNLLGKYQWPFSISTVTLTAVRSAQHNSLSRHSLAAVCGWNLEQKVRFTCLIYLQNTLAHTKGAIFSTVSLFWQNKSKWQRKTLTFFTFVALLFRKSDMIKRYIAILKPYSNSMTTTLTKHWIYIQGWNWFSQVVIVCWPWNIPQTTTLSIIIESAIIM